MRIAPLAPGAVGVLALWLGDRLQWNRPELLLFALAALSSLWWLDCWWLGLGRRRWLGLLCLAFAFFASAAGEQRGLERAEQRWSHALDDRDYERIRGTIEGLIEEGMGSLAFVLATGDERIAVRLRRDGPVRAEPRPGDEVEVSLRLARARGERGTGTSSRRRQLRARGVQLQGRGFLSSLHLLARRGGWWRWAQRARDGCRNALSHEGAQTGAAVVRALACGDRSGIDEERSEQLRAAGLAHLLAVSGMHLGAVSWISYSILLWLWSLVPWRHWLEPRHVGAAGALVAAAGFGLMTGMRPSTQRALALIALYTLAMLGDRKPSFLRCLVLVFAGLLLWRPSLLWDPGFQLSFGASAVLGVALAAPADVDEGLKLGVVGRGPSLGERARAWLWLSLRTSFWATWATAPLALAHFHEWSWAGILSNLVAVPLVVVALLPLCMGALASQCLLPALAAPLVGLATGLARWLVEGSSFVARLLPLQHRSPFEWWEWGLWILLGVLVGVRRTRGLVKGGALVLLASWLVYPSLFEADRARPDLLRVTFVDVGQGDAALLELASGELWLIDGGGLPFSPEGDATLASLPARRQLVPLLRHRGIERIDLVVVSHPHPDHVAGLTAVAEELAIDEVWFARGSARRGSSYESWLAELEARGTRILSPPLGLARRSGAVEAQVLWPRYGEDEGARESAADPILSVNDNSLVVRVDAAGRRLLFAGDIEEESEELMAMALGKELDVDLVKVPHHGSRSSSTELFVQLTTPVIAVVSCGLANRFDFPAGGVLERWTRAGAALFRTDLHGSVELSIRRDGTMELRTMSRPPAILP